MFLEWWRHRLHLFWHDRSVTELADQRQSQSPHPWSNASNQQILLSNITHVHHSRGQRKQWSCLWGSQVVTWLLLEALCGLFFSWICHKHSGSNNRATLLMWVSVWLGETAAMRRNKAGSWDELLFEMVSIPKSEFHGPLWMFCWRLWILRSQLKRWHDRATVGLDWYSRMHEMKRQRMMLKWRAIPSIHKWTCFYNDWIRG